MCKCVLHTRQSNRMDIIEQECYVEGIPVGTARNSPISIHWVLENTHVESSDKSTKLCTVWGMSVNCIKEQPKAYDSPARPWKLTPQLPLEPAPTPYTHSLPVCTPSLSQSRHPEPVPSFCICKLPLEPSPAASTASSLQAHCCWHGVGWSSLLCSLY